MNLALARRVLTATVGGVILLAISTSSEQVTASQAQVQFRSDAEQGWARLLKWNRSVEIKGVSIVSQNDEVLEKVRVHYCRIDDRVFAMQDSTPFAKPGGKGLFAVNGSYGFWAKQKGGKSDWSLQVVETTPAKRRGLEQEIRSRYFDMHLAHSHYGSKESWLDLSRSGDFFQWESAEKVQVGGVELVHVPIKSSVVTDRYPDPVLYVGYVRFDPKNAWCCTEIETRNEPRHEDKRYPIYSRREVTYAEERVAEIRPVQKVKRVGRWGKVDRGEGGLLATFEVESVQLPQVPQSAFTLSGYGLPEVLGEPPAPPQQRSFFWAWVAAAAILCLLVAAALRRRYGSV